MTLALFFFLKTTAHASEVVTSSKTSSVSALTLPTCIDDAAKISSILDTEKANSKTEFKYRGFQSALSSDSDTELMARLAYSEALAANCPQQTSSLIEPVANVIANRVRVRKGDVRSVVFQKDQFASSLNNYTESRFRDFLCPHDADLWKQALAAIQKTQASNTLGISSDVFNYYLFQHSARFKAPAWAEQTSARFKDSDKIQACVKFYRENFK